MTEWSARKRQCVFVCECENELLEECETTFCHFAFLLPSIHRCSSLYPASLLFLSPLCHRPNIILSLSPLQPWTFPKHLPSSVPFRSHFLILSPHLPSIITYSSSSSFPPFLPHFCSFLLLFFSVSSHILQVTAEFLLFTKQHINFIFTHII